MTQTRLQPWTEEKLKRREDVFEALTAKALKQTMRAVTANLDGIVTAAAAPEPEEVSLPQTPSDVAPPFSLTMLETAVTATWNTHVGAELFPFLVDTMLESANLVAIGVKRATGTKPDVFSSDFAAEQLALANNRMVNIGNQVWTQIRDQLSEGFAAGEGIQQLAARLNTVAGLSTPRALVTARTEVIGAANAGAYEQMVFAGFTDDEASKEWLATEDPRTRKSHRDADGQRAPLSQPFTVDVYEGDVKIGEEPLKFPGDPSGSAGNVINCRCSIAFVFDDDEQDEDPVTAAGFDESKVKRDSEGKFAKKASRALGGIDKLTGKQTKAGKKVMLRTKVLFGTTYQDGAIIAVRPGSNERIIWNAADEKVLRQKKNVDGKYETVESLTRGATYAKYGNEDGWESPAAGQNIAVAPTTVPDVPADPGPTIPTAPKVAEEATQGAEISAPQTVVNKDKTVNPTTYLALKKLLDPSVAEGETVFQSAHVAVKKGPLDESGQPVLLFERAGAMAYKVPFDTYNKPQFGDNEFWKAYDSALTMPAKSPADALSPITKKYGNYDIAQIKDALGSQTTPGGFVFGEVDGIKIQKGYPQAPGAPAALVFVKDEKTAKIYTYNQAKNFTEADFDAAIAEMKATKSKIKPKLTSADEAKALINNSSPVAAPVPSTPSVDPLKKANNTATPITSTDNIPAHSELKPTGKQLGTHWGQVYTDNDGNEWLFKQTSYGKTAYAVAEDVGYKIHDLAGLPTPASAVTTLNGNFGNIQKMFPNVKTLSPHNFNPASLDTVQQFQLQKEHVFDWLVSNHDSHAGNFLVDSNKDLIGIDKGQAFRWLGVDKLDIDFKPNPNEQAANAFYKAYANGKINKVHPATSGALHDYILKLQNIPDADYREVVRPYAEAAAKEGKLGAGGPSYLGLKQTKPFPSNDVEAFLDAAVARKNSLLADYTKFLKNVEAKRAANLGLNVAPAVSLPAPSSIPTATGTADILKPKKMSHGVLQNPKTTQYKHGTVVAIRQDEDVRLRWNENTKKYDFERKALMGGWFVDKSYSKQAAYKTFGGQDGWFEPLDSTGAQTDQQTGVAPVPTLAGNPSAPTIVATPKPPKSAKFSPAALAAQTADISHLTSPQLTSIGGKFKYGKGAAVTLKSQGSKIFQQALAAQKHFNNSPSVTSGTVQPLTLLQTIKAIDVYAANPYNPLGGGNQNNNAYEKLIVAWMQTPSGKTNAQKYLDATVVVPGSTPGTNTTALTEKLTQAVFDVPLSSPEANAAGPFPVVSLTEAEKIYDEMTKNNPWSSATVAAAKTYTGSSYSNINGSLRKKDSQGNPFTPKPASLRTAKSIQEGMRPIPYAITVHRGIHNAQQFGISDNSLAALQALVGKSFQDKGFMSTGVAGGGFSGSIRLVIELPKGTPAMYIRNISQFKNGTENEMLLAAGTKFTVLEVTQSGYQKVVRMRVIP